MGASTTSIVSLVVMANKLACIRHVDRHLACLAFN